MGLADAFREEISVFMKEDAGPEAQADHLAAYAKQWLADAQSAGRVSPIYDTFVDGRKGADERTVRPNGVIRYEFSYLAQAALFALAYLKARAPKSSGEYRESFFFAVNGRFILDTEFNPRKVPPGATVILGNSAPYHRKVEIQLAGIKRLRFNVPSGAMQQGVAVLNREFSGLAKAEYLNNIDFPGKYVLKQEQFHLSGRYKGRSRKRAGKPVDSPAIQISEAA